MTDEQLRRTIAGIIHDECTADAAGIVATSKTLDRIMKAIARRILTLSPTPTEDPQS